MWGTLQDPLLVAEERDRDRYVPNVVYSCGSIFRVGHVIVPYGVATFPLEDLLRRLSPNAS